MAPSDAIRAAPQVLSGGRLAQERRVARERRGVRHLRWREDT